MADASPRGAPERTEAERRRTRTGKYLEMWAVLADGTAVAPDGPLHEVPVVLSDDVVLRSSTETIGRLHALTLLSLKGQGLTQYETFAYADAHGVWDSFTVAENDFVLDPDPPREQLVQQAWRYEGAVVLQWAVGVHRHLAFPDQPTDPATVVGRTLESVAGAVEPDSLALRPDKDLLDAADIARCLAALAAGARGSGSAMPGGVHPGVVYEREQAFRWLIGL